MALTFPTPLVMGKEEIIEDCGVDGSVDTILSNNQHPNQVTNPTTILVLIDDGMHLITFNPSRSVFPKLFQLAHHKTRDKFWRTTESVKTSSADYNIESCSTHLTIDMVK